MTLDPTKLKDWQIAEAAEGHMLPLDRLAAVAGLDPDEFVPYGRQLGRIDYARTLERLRDAPQGKYIDVTAITPTPLGEG
ncbi:MAG: formate--tetrahydrofolate ligase, partial [Verrucomicrobia bacterium]|nr:formate--tetrahydrofolate ligase [Verrucomicrobiota bacterium]